jgi:hypothetical protein
MADYTGSFSGSFTGSYDILTHSDEYNGTTYGYVLHQRVGTGKAEKILLSDFFRDWLGSESGSAGIQDYGAGGYIFDSDRILIRSGSYVGSTFRPILKTATISNLFGGYSNGSLRNTFIYARGVGRNTEASPTISSSMVLTVGGQILYEDNDGVGDLHGLTLTILEATDFSKVSTTRYNTALGGATAAADSLATAIDDMSPTEIGVITSLGHWETYLSNNLRTAAKKVGLSKLGGYLSSDSGSAYAAVFYGTSGSAGVSDSLERLVAYRFTTGSNLDIPTATITTRVQSNTHGIYPFVNISDASSTNALYRYSANTASVTEPALLVNSAGNINAAGDVVTFKSDTATITMDMSSSSDTFLFVDGYVSTSGHIVPSTTELYDLGSTDLRWRDLYLSGSTIYLGTSQLSSDGTNTSGSFTGSFGGEGTNITGVVSSSYADSSSYAVTASYAINGGSGGGGGTPGGSTTQIQYNNAGAFGGASGFVWDSINSRVGLGTGSPSEKLDVVGNALFSNNVTVSGNIVVNTIAERTAASGVTIDSVLLKDGGGTFTGDVTISGLIDQNVASTEVHNMTNTGLPTSDLSWSQRISNPSGDYEIRSTTDAGTTIKNAFRLAHATGNATFVGNVVPATDSAASLGLTGTRWDKVFTDQLDIDATDDGVPALTISNTKTTQYAKTGLVLGMDEVAANDIDSWHLFNQKASAGAATGQSDFFVRGYTKTNLDYINLIHADSSLQTLYFADSDSGTDAAIQKEDWTVSVGTALTVGGDVNITVGNLEMAGGVSIDNSGNIWVGTQDGNTAPNLYFVESDAQADESRWRIVTSDGDMFFQAREDVGDGFINTTWMRFERSAYTATSVKIGADLLPSVNNTLDLGSDALRWNNVYVGGDVSLNGSTTLGGLSNNTANSASFGGFAVEDATPGGTRFGSYGLIHLYANTNLTSGARQYYITNAIDGNKFGIIRSTDATTVPTIDGASGGVDSGIVDFAIDNIGNAGIGTSSPSSYNSTGDNLVIYGDSPGMTFASDEGVGAAGSYATIIFADGTSGTDAYTGYIRYKFDTEDLLFYGNGGTYKMIISGSGNVGIGTSSPAASLHSTGVGYFEGGTFVALDTVSNAGIVISENDFIYTYDGGRLRKLIGKENDVIEIGSVNTSLTDEIRFYPGDAGGITTFYDSGTEIMRVGGSDRRVGIGTNAPDSNLEIYEEGASATRQMLHVNSTLTSGDSTGATLSYPASITSTVSGGTAISRVMNWVKIDADAANNNTVMNRNLISTDSGTTFEVGGMDLYSSNHFDVSRRALFVHSSDVPIWFTAASNISSQIGESDDIYVQMALTTAGNVGIGTTSPDGLLHISAGNSGDARLIIQADEDNNDENDVPQIWFKADGDITEGLIGLNNNYLDFVSNVSSGGFRFFTGTTSNTGTTDPYTGATEKVTITSAGDVTVTGGITTGGNSTLGNAITDSHTINGSLTINDDAGTASTTISVDNDGRYRSNSENGGMWCWTDTFVGRQGPNSVGLYSSSQWGLVTQGNQTGINDTTPSYTLDVNGTIRAVTDVIVTSDIRLKNELPDTVQGLETVDKLRPIKYTLKDDEDENPKTHLGFSAQELLDIVPEVVNTDEEGYHSVSYQKLVPVLVKAIQELTEEVRELKKKVEE